MVRIRSISSRFSAGLNPAAGSSRHSSVGSVASARAISRRRWSPYGRLRASSSARRDRPMNSSSSRARSYPCCSSRRCRGSRNSALPIPVLWLASAPTRMFSRAVMLPNSRMFWNVRAMPSLVIAKRLFPPMLLPLNNTWPDVGAYTPVIVLKQVVLPAPFGPIRPRISPGRRSRDTSARATTPPKRMVTLRSDNSASAGARTVSAADSGTGRPLLELLEPLVQLLGAHAPARREQALRTEVGQQHEQHPEDQHPEVGEGPEQLGQVGDDDGAEHDAPAVARAADDHGCDEQDGQQQLERLRVDERLPGRKQRAGQTADEGADREREQLELERRYAHQLGGVLVLPGRLPRAADAAALQCLVR